MKIVGMALLLPCTCVVVLLLGSPLAAADRPNILLLFADDQRADTIAAWGNPHIQTPNLDGLVARGFSFRRNYCFGSNSGAVCVPSRAMLMSGRTWFHVNAQIKGVPIMPEVLGAHGYVTFGTGKWHNGRPSFLRGFQKGKSIFFGGMNDHTRTTVEDLGPEGTLVNQRVGKKFSSEMFADAVIEFLKGYRGDKPFFAYVAFTAPHDPRNPPVKYRQMYYKNRPPLPKNFLPQHPFNNGHVTGRDENLAAWPRTREVISDQLAEYYGLITHLDEQIGRILETLDKSPHGKNTLIVYAADHGLALGSHGLLGKQSVYEDSMHCPLIFVGPGIPAGKSSQAFSYLLDIFPTLCDVLDIPPPKGVEGKSLKPIWTGKKEKVRDTVFLPFQKFMRAVRDERWKLIVYPQINHRQLFDLQKDPYEIHNLAGDPAHQATIERLEGLLKEWQKKVGDNQVLEVARPAPKKIDLTGRPRKPDRWQPEWIRKKYFGGATP
jgi:arylsulfatase A-like enzyme